MCSGLNRSAISLLKECGLSFTLISINIEPLRGCLPTLRLLLREFGANAGNKTSPNLNFVGSTNGPF